MMESQRIQNSQYPQPWLAKVHVELGVSIEKSLSKVLSTTQFELGMVKDELENLIDDNNHHQRNNQKGGGGDDDESDEDDSNVDDDADDDVQIIEQEEDDSGAGGSAVKKLFKNNDKLLLQLQILHNTIATLHEWKENLESIVSDYVSTIGSIKPAARDE
jgi:hypothetical protein